MSEEKSETKRKLKFIQRFLCVVCAGMDKRVLNKYPTEWNKYSGYGAAVLLTGIWASLSGGYAIYAVLRNGNFDVIDKIDKDAMPFAIGFGFLWGLTIFNIDRLLVSTFRKADKDTGGFWKRTGYELRQAFPRVILAVIIGIIMSTPIEIWICGDRLKEQIQQNMNDARDKNQSNLKEINNISVKTKEKIATEQKDSTLQKELAEDPQIVKNIINNELAEAKSKLSEIQRINQPKIDNHNQSIRNIVNNRSNYRTVYDAEGNVEHDATGNIKQSLTKEALNNIGRHNSEMKKLRNEINAKQEEIRRINNQIAKERSYYQERKKAEIDANDQAKKVAEASLDSVTVKFNAEMAKSDRTSQEAFSNNLIAQIEALGVLVDNNFTVRMVYLLMTLLVLAIELFPILSKLLSKRGPCDGEIECIECEIMMEQQFHIDQIDLDIKERLLSAEKAAKLKGDIIIRMTEEKLNTELANNKVILNQIVEYQQEIALEILKKWRDEELEKLK